MIQPISKSEREDDFTDKVRLVLDRYKWEVVRDSWVDPIRRRWDIDYKCNACRLGHDEKCTCDHGNVQWAWHDSRNVVFCLAFEDGFWCERNSPREVLRKFVMGLALRTHQNRK